jgi:uncharacterized membrane protein
MLYTSFKFLHIIFAIIAIGFNISYAIWFTRSTNAGKETTLFTLNGVRVLDNRFANPAYVLLLVTGVTMTFIAGIPLTTLWILISLVLYVVAMALGIAVYAPTLRRQIQVLETEGADSPEYVALSNRGQILGIVLGIVVALIVAMMVFKPTL